MSVGLCNGECCKNSMRETFVPEIGFICFECKEEFKEYLEQYHNDEILTSYKMITHLKRFMNTVKKTFSKSEETTVDDFFGKYTE